MTIGVPLVDNHGIVRDDGSPTTSSAPAPRRVLVVDDMATNRKLLRAALEHAGYRVVEATDGLRALAVLEREPVDAVISDILMPNMDGYRLCHELRRSERWRNLPFIFYSSTYRSAADEKLAQEIGGDLFVAKPATPAKILGALAELIGSSRAAGHAELTLDGELGLMKQYSARLVSRLEEQNAELYQRTSELEAEIAERERAQAALARSESHFRDLFDQATEAIVVTDASGHCVDVNPAGCRMIGYSRDELLEMSLLDVVPPVEVPRIGTDLARFAGGQIVTTEWYFRRKDGATLLVETTGRRLSDGRLLAFVRDITERRRGELERQQNAQRMRALARRLVETRETEQRWLSAELHDRIGQTLTALGINLNIVAGALPPGTPGAVAERLRDSRGLVEATIASVRDLISELRPAALDDYGLLAGLRWFGEQIRARTRLDMEVAGAEPVPRLAPDVEVALFRIAQEALNNTVKHADARRASVKIRCRSGTCFLSIEDDGVGFDPDQPAQPGARTHWGLEMMRERAEAVGARFRVDSAPGRGTRIEVEVEFGRAA